MFELTGINDQINRSCNALTDLIDTIQTACIWGIILESIAAIGTIILTIWVIKKVFNLTDRGMKIAETKAAEQPPEVKKEMSDEEKYGPK